MANSTVGADIRAGSLYVSFASSQVDDCTFCDRAVKSSLRVTWRYAREGVDGLDGLWRGRVSVCKGTELRRGLTVATPCPPSTRTSRPCRVLRSIHRPGWQ